MYCSHCGKELRQGAKFCPYCGKQQRQSQVGQPETAPTREAEVSSPAAPVEPAVPKGGKMERRKRILLLCLAAVVIVAIAAGLIVTHVKGKALEIRRRPKAAAQPADNADGDKDDAPPAP